MLREYIPLFLYLSIILPLSAYAVITDGLGPFEYVECPEYSAPCKNPYIHPLGWCTKEYTHPELCLDPIPTGSVIGHKPSWITRNLLDIFIIATLILYLYRDVSWQKIRLKNRPKD